MVLSFESEVTGERRRGYRGLGREVARRARRHPAQAWRRRSRGLHRRRAHHLSVPPEGLHRAPRRGLSAGPTAVHAPAREARAYAADARRAIQEAEWRRRWRSVVLVAKAKLELVASGGSTFEREFLADMLLANGETMAEAMLPRVLEMYETGNMPSLLLGAGGGNG